MKNKLLILFLAFSFSTQAADYNIDDVHTQTISVCSGNFYDSGGSASKYSNNEDYRVTFCSDDGNAIAFNFTAFRVENGYDYLYVHDGGSTSSSQISGSPFTGNGALLGTITSSGTCLTFRFTSDINTKKSGWEASISCSAPPACDDGNTGNCCSEGLASNAGFEDSFTASERFPNSSYPINALTGDFSEWFYADGGYNSEIEVLINDATRASEGNQFIYIPLASNQSGPYNYCVGNTLSYSSTVTTCGSDTWFDDLRYVGQIDWAPFNQSVPGGGTGNALPAVETETFSLTNYTLYKENGTTLSSGETTVDWDDVSTSWQTAYIVTSAITTNTSLTFYVSNDQASTAGVLIDNTYFAPLRVTGAGLGSVDCGASTDEITFTLNPESNVGSVPNILYDVCVDSDYSISPSQGTYGQTTTFTLTKNTGNFSTGSPFAIDVIVKDEVNTDCYVKAQVLNPYPCEATIGNLIWLDENTDGIPDVGEPGIPGVTVNLKDGPTTVASTVTDANGYYIFKGVDIQSYTVEVQSGTLPTGLTIIYDEDDATSSPDGQTVVTVSANQEYLTASFGYNYASKSNTDAPISMTAQGALGNRIWNDVNGNGIQDLGEPGIKDVSITLLTDPDLDGIYTDSGTSTTTDASGRYIFTNLTPGAYMLEIDETTLSGFNTTPVSDPDGDSNNFLDPVIIAPGDVWLEGDFGYNRNSSVFDIGSYVYIDVDGDGVRDAGTDPGVQGVTVTLILDSNSDGDWDSNEKAITNQLTDQNGYYLFTELPNDNYVIVVTDTENVLSRYDNIGDPDGGSNEYSGVTINSADQLTQNFGYAPTGHTSGKGFIGDFVFLDLDGGGDYDAGEPGIEGVTVYLLDDATDDIVGRAYTDENGRYYFGNLDDGDYRVQVLSSTLPSGVSPSDDPDNSVPADNEGAAITISGGSNNMVQTFGYEADTPRNISGTIWIDSNAEGTLDGTETTRVQSVSIVLLDSDKNIIAETSTDGSGNYSFTGVPAGSYTVEVTDKEQTLHGYWHTIGTDSETDPIAVDVSSGNVSGLDFGYYNANAAVGNLVWVDYNGDGLQNSNEPGLEGAKITLEIDYNNDGTADVSAVVVSDLTGGYGFRHVMLDEDYQGDGTGTEPDYELIVEEPNNAFTSALTYQGGNSNQDSDNHSGTAIQPVKGQDDISQSNTTDSQASFDYAYEFDCTRPSADYAVVEDASNGSASVTTSHLLDYENGVLKHVDKSSQKYGTIRSYTYCVHGDWRYYYNPLEPDEYLFAIRMNSGGGVTYNTTEIEYIEIRIDDNATDRYANDDLVNSDFATFGMIRDWHIKTVNDDPLDEAIDVRFYFPENEFKQLYDAAIDKAVNDWGGTAPGVDSIQWFQKATFDPDVDIDYEGTILDAAEMTALQLSPTTAAGVNTQDKTSDGGQAVGADKNHVQFNGITSFGGGTAEITLNALTVLPVELARFDGEVDVCEVRLTWTSLSEEDFSHYELERSADGSVFEEIELINAAGGANSKTYQYLDRAALKKNYYRLKMVDLDGSFEYSEVIEITTDCGVVENINVYPNPVGDQILNLKIKTRIESTERIRIVDLMGRVLFENLVDLHEGFNTIQFDASNLSKGVYFIKVGNRTKSKFAKIDQK